MAMKVKSSGKRKKFNVNIARIERGRYHLIVRQTVLENGLLRKRPVLWFMLPNANGIIQPSILQPLLDYYADHSARSYTWMKNTARGVGTLIDHSLAVGSSPSFNQWKEAGILPKRLLRGLATSLVHGTMEIAPNGRIIDRTGLYWSPLGKRQAGVLLSALTLHFKWMKDQPAAAAWVKAASTDAVAENPRIALNLASELLIRKQNSLLGHLKGVERAPPHALPAVVGQSHSAVGAVPTFPAKYVGPLLYTSFTDGAGECDEAAQLLAHLIIALGLRKSEGFHLYTSDIQFVGDVPWIFFHHPETGKIADNGGGYISRTEYLQRFGIQPRNKIKGRNEAGWKGMADDDQGTPGYFLPIPSLRKRICKLLKRYIYVTRPAIMARRPGYLGDHPFLFVSNGRTATSTGGDVGDPYTMSAFEHSWQRGIRRIGLQFDDPTMARPLKRRGTTPHGGRHLYGRFLFTSGVEGRTIQSCMHHRSLDAHKVYTRLTPSEINAILTDAYEGRTSKYSFRNIRDEFMSQFQDPFRGSSNH